MTYHEKVARAMANTFSVGSMSSYETILARLQEKSEAELRRMIKELEARLPLGALGFQFVEEEQQQQEEK